MLRVHAVLCFLAVAFLLCHSLNFNGCGVEQLVRLCSGKEFLEVGREDRGFRIYQAAMMFGELVGGSLRGG